MFLCLIQNHYLRFQLAQNEFESEAIDTFVRFLSRRQTLTLVLAAAAFGFIVPHVTVPVHSGLRLAYAFGFGVLGGACGAGLACLISFIVKTAKKSYRTDREKFFWTLKNGGIPYSVLAVVGTAAILVGLTIFAKNAEVSVPISTDYANSYFALRQSMSEKNAELFTEHPNTLYETTALETTLDEAQLNAAITESMRPREILLGKASYYFVKPVTAECIAQRICELVAPAAPSYNVLPEVRDKRRAASVDEKISNIFISIGIPPHIKGYQYLREGIKMAVENPAVINSVTKELYPAIGKKFATTASKVERAIRHAIEVAWNRGRVDAINAIFGVRVYIGSERPTNSEFIALVADKLILEDLI